jgi:hypothetical protein
LEYKKDLENLKVRLPELKAERTWKFGKLVQQICREESMEKIREIPVASLDWHSLCLNENSCVMEFLRENKTKIVISVLSKNSSDAAVDLLLELQVDWFAASFNTNDRITCYFPEINKPLCITALSGNTSDFVVNWLLSTKMYDQIFWPSFCTNPNKYAVEHIFHLSMTNPNDKRIDWGNLCRNPSKSVFEILRNNQNKIDWKIFLKNPICFSYNYEMIEKRVSVFKEELTSIALSPEKVMHAISTAREDDEDDFEVISRLDF